MKSVRASRLDRPAFVEWLGGHRPLQGLVHTGHAAWFRIWYRATWKVKNAKARRALAAAPPALTDTQQAVVNELHRAGIAHVHYDDLIGDPDRWTALVRLVEEWVATPGVQEAERRYRASAARARTKEEYLVRLYRGQGQEVLLSWDCPWLRLALEPAILDIANSYLGLWSRLYHVDVWNTIAAGSAEPPTGSQRWHRDPADLVLLKVFLYFSDVTAESGALQYVPGSRRDERYGRLWRHPLFNFGGRQPPADDFDARIPPSDWVTCAHPRGTLVFVDTTGFHRGGRAAAANRVLATWAYSTPASRWRRAFRVDPGAAPADALAPARHAVWT